MGFADVRVSYHKRSTVYRRAPSASCATGGFYTAPQNGATVDSMKPLLISWDTSCINTTLADIYLFSATSSLARIHVWKGVSFTSGHYNATLYPRWWNSTSSQRLQLAIVPANNPPFLTTLPAGPVITATYTAPASGSVPAAADTSKSDSGITQVNASLSKPSTSLSPGRTAVAVLLPILFVGLCIAAYFRFQRAKQHVKTKRFSEALDKRMSTISADWKSISAAGANAAIRNSLASGARHSTAFSFGNIRPPSNVGSISIVPSQAGVGSYHNTEKGQMTQVRTGTGIGLRYPAAANGSDLSLSSTERISRISFAADTRFSRGSTHVDSRPSVESSRRGVPTRAFHSGYVPPVPAVRPEIVSVYNEKVKEKETQQPEELSPRQTAGPLMLMPEEIRSRMQGSNKSGGDENGIDEEEGDEYLLSIPEPAHTNNANNDLPLAMSPDEMLRQYAAKRAASGGVSTPPPSSSSSLKIKGRKLSLRSIGIGKRLKSDKGIEGGLDVGSTVEPWMVIDYPAPAAIAAGGTGFVSPMQGQGHYAIGEEEEPESHEDAYGGVTVH
ncbi:hypothetical protein L208DRAFT_1422395 [Tricholoma matsutake]|nr:hypothetical protein L208DRAFT_1422395 [Tricholoma matsutake 945]